MYIDKICQPDIDVVSHSLDCLIVKTLQSVNTIRFGTDFWMDLNNHCGAHEYTLWVGRSGALYIAGVEGQVD